MNLAKEMGNEELSRQYAVAIDEQKTITPSILKQTKEWLLRLEVQNERKQQV